MNPFYGSMSDIPDEAFDKTMNSNVRSNHCLCQMVSNDMLEKGSGSIMITSSTGAFSPSETLGTYNISKLADIALVRNLAAEWGPKGVRVNALCPGLIKTDFAKALWEGGQGDIVAQSYPLKRLGETQDIASAALYLSSESSGWMTGQTLVLDGGGLVSFNNLS